MKIYKPSFWSSINFFSIILFPISLIVKLLIFVKKKISKPLNFKIPIICVGNIYLGGTGKTPLSIFLASELKAKGKKTAIIRKYYKKHRDEHLMIKDRFKNLFLNTNRVNAISEAIDKSFDLLILDDGFQDTQIMKNLNVICFNQKQKIGNGMIIPSGPLRESIYSLKNAHIVVINGGYDMDFEKKILDINQDISIFYSRYVPVNIEKFKKKKLLAIAGIGNPENFFNLLSDNNLDVSKKMVFPDHYKFKKKEILDIVKYANTNNYKLIMTEKDFYKIKEYDFKDIEFLRVSLEIENKEQFLKKIFNKINESY